MKKLLLLALDHLREVTKMIVISGLVLVLGGCATPTRTITARTWAADGLSTRTETVIAESGWQLAWGERHDVVSGPGVAAGSDISKRTMGIVAGALGGALLGFAAGNPAVGALVGTVAGGLSQAIDGTVNPSATSTDLVTLLGASNELAKLKASAKIPAVPTPTPAAVK